MRRKLFFIPFLFIIVFSTQINSQIKLSKSEIEKVKAKYVNKNGELIFFFELNGNKIGPSIVSGNGIYGYHYNAKGQKDGAQILIRNQHIKVDIFKKDKNYNSGFNYDDGDLIYANEYKEYYKDGALEMGYDFREKEYKQRNCVGNCKDGFGYIRYKSSKTDVLGFFKNSYPEGAVYVVNPRGSYYGSFKKGYRQGNAILISKNKKEIRHAGFKKGKIIGLELYFYPTKEIARAYYRNSKGNIIKEYVIENFRGNRY